MGLKEVLGQGMMDFPVPAGTTVDSLLAMMVEKWDTRREGDVKDYRAGSDVFIHDVGGAPVSWLENVMALIDRKGKTGIYRPRSQDTIVAFSAGAMG
jgi:hypothetical protein